MRLIFIKHSSIWPEAAARVILRVSWRPGFDPWSGMISVRYADSHLQVAVRAGRAALGCPPALLVPESCNMSCSELLLALSLHTPYYAWPQELLRP